MSSNVQGNGQGTHRLFRRDFGSGHGEDERLAVCLWNRDYATPPKPISEIGEDDSTKVARAIIQV